MKLLIKVIAVVILSVLTAVVMADVPGPLAMTNRMIGGGRLNSYTPGVEGGFGINNIGLLVRLWGKVTYRDTDNKFFYINDGSNRIDGTKVNNVYILGVRVSYDNLATGNTINPPDLDRYVMVTGISSTILVDSKIQPNLRPRRDADLKTVF